MFLETGIIGLHFAADSTYNSIFIECRLTCELMFAGALKRQHQAASSSSQHGILCCFLYRDTDT